MKFGLVIGLLVAWICSVVPVIGSEAGVIWTPRASGTSHGLKAVCWDGRQFVAVGDFGTVLTSPNGVTWTSRQVGDRQLLDVIWAGDRLVAVGQSTILTSPDGVVWTAASNVTGWTFKAVEWNGSNQFVAVGKGDPWTSPDGIVWTRHELNIQTFLKDFTALAWNGSKFLAMGMGGALLSYEGIYWSRFDVMTGDAVYCVVWDGSHFIAIGMNRVLPSVDGSVWRPQDRREVDLGTPMYGLVWTGTQYVTVGILGRISTSADGVSWVRRSTGTEVALQSVAWNGSLLVAVGDGGTILTSGTLPPQQAPSYTRHPAHQNVVPTFDASFSVAVSGNPVPSVQWQVSLNGGETWTAVSNPGPIPTVLKIEGVTTEMNGRRYRTIATNGEGAATSEEAVLNVVSVPEAIPPGFDVIAYLRRNPEVAANYGTDLMAAWEYFRDEGIYQGQFYDDLFRPEEYLALYPELLAVLGPDLKKALLHWLAEGRIEGRLGRIPLEFDVAGYFERNPDVAAAMGGNPILGWQHFWNYGIYEGRAYDDEFRAFEYLALNEDLQAAFLNDWRGATLHWLRYGRIEGRLGRVPPIFDVNFYLTQYPDVAAVWGTYQSTVFLHYYGFGVYEARIFDNEFRVDDYIALNPDLQAVFGTDRRGAFMHWVRWGRSEGRQAKAP